MSTVNQDELKAIKVLKLTGKESEWDHLSEKFVALARARGFAGILLGTERRHPEHTKRLINESRWQLGINRSRKKREEKTQAGKWQCIHNFAAVM